MKRFIVSLAVALGLLVPAAAFAQTSTTGLLSVYVQVTNSPGFNLSPGNFNVSVSGQNPQPSTFQGSINGTLVSLNPGSYSVSLTNTANVSVSYSTGCTNTIAANQTQLCVITVSPTTNQYYPTPYPYPYPYTQPLTCQANLSSVALGQSVTFRALGGSGGAYNWATAYNNYPNNGPTLNISFQNSGTQVVTVTNGPMTAQCTVVVTNTYYPGSAYQNPLYPTYPTYTGYPMYPSLPSTGFAPAGTLGIVFSIVLLMTAGLATLPYVRRALASAVR